ncbi:MAG: LUD domain-containing protein, partial [Methermicoccaceae archaeon]
MENFKSSDSLRKAFDRVKKSIQEGPDWLKEERQKLSDIREDALNRLDSLWEMADASLQKSGFEVVHAKTRDDAIDAVLAELRKNEMVVKSKTNISRELHLRDAFEEAGIEVIETDLGDRIHQLTGGRPSHPTAPIAHLSKEEIITYVSEHTNREIDDVQGVI